MERAMSVGRRFRAMNIALTVWNDRVSPVFDVARNFLVFEIENGEVINTRLQTFENDQPLQKASQLSGEKIDTLICGAISQPLAELITSYGIHTVPFIAGNAEKVINAYLTGRLSNPAFLMPGCGQKRRRHGRPSMPTGTMMGSYRTDSGAGNWPGGGRHHYGRRK
jgi:predicted Fe-Mo cluster-binding NifX family protein